MAQAITITMPIVPIRTHKSVRNIADHVHLRGRRAGAMRQLRLIRGLTAGGCRPRGHPDRHHPARRRRWPRAIVTPGFSRATALKAEARRASAGSDRSANGSDDVGMKRRRARNPSGSTPTISRGRESTIKPRPTTDRSPAEMALPVAVADHHGSGRARDLVGAARASGPAPAGRRTLAGCRR